MNDKPSAANIKDDPWLPLMLAPRHDSSPGGIGIESSPAKSDARSRAGEAMKAIGGTVQEVAFMEISWLHRPQAELADPAEIAERREAAAAVAGALECLPETQKKLLHSTYYYGKTIAATARSLGRSPQSVRQSLSWARAALARVLQGWI